MNFNHQLAVLLLFAISLSPLAALAATDCGYPCDMSKSATMKKPMAMKAPMAPMEATAENAKKAIANAEAARKKAASVDSEWRDTAKFIKQATKAADEGDFAQAIKLATKAEHEGNLGYEQGASQSMLKMPSYLKY